MDYTNNNHIISHTPKSTDTIEEVDESDDGVDNPFRPGGGLSKEADIIVQLIKAGKSISPNSPTREDILALEAFKEHQEANGLLETSSSSSSPFSPGRQRNLPPDEVDGNIIRSQVNNINGKVFLSNNTSSKKNGNNVSSGNHLDNNRNFSPVNGKTGNNNKPSSPEGTSPHKKNSTSSPDHNLHAQSSFDQQVVKKDAKRACCVIQ
jgi:hypothetical protein